MAPGPPSLQRPPPLGLLLFLAVQSLLASRLTAALLVAAVAAGVGFQIPNTANLLGYRAELLDQGIAAGLGDVRLRPAHGLVFHDAGPLVDRVRREPGVRAVSAVLTVSGSVAAAGREIGVPVFGIDPAAARQPYRFLSGEPFAAGDPSGVLLGVGLANRLGVHPGDTVEVRAILGNGLSPAAEDMLQQACSLGLVADCSRATSSVRLRRWPLRVRGIVGGVFSAYQAIFVDLAFLRAESELAGGASMLLVYSDDAAGAQPLAARLGAAVPAAEALAWMDDSQYLQSSVASVDALSAVSHAMVVSAVVIPVWALLYVNVQARRREIGVMGAIGLGRGTIFLTFLAQALLVGVTGALLGCALGYALVRWFIAHPIFDWYGFVIRPVVSVRAFVEPALVVLGAAVLAGVLPAVRASRVDPARVLRGLE